MSEEKPVIPTRTRIPRKDRTAPLQSGVLVLWNDAKGFGFVRPDAAVPGQDDWFLHISALKKGMERRPETGDKVRYVPDTVAVAKKKLAYAEIVGMPYGQIKPDIHGVLQQPMSVYVRMLVISPFICSLYLIWVTHNPVPLFSYGFFSVLTILLYGVDKTRSLSGAWRIPEIYFHCLQALGGWPGGLIAQNDFRHKRRKETYQRWFRAMIILHGLLWAIAIYRDFKF